jgi:hypothetical protein
LLRWGIHNCLDEAYVPFFGAFGTVWPMPKSANPLGMLWPEMDAAFVRQAVWQPRATRPSVRLLATVSQAP